MKKRIEKRKASSEKKAPPPEPTWPGIFLRKLAPPPHDVPVTILHVRLNQAGEVCSFHFTPINDQRTTESAMAAYNLAITSYLEAQKEQRS